MTNCLMGNWIHSKLTSTQRTPLRDVGLELVAQSLALLDEGLDAKLRGRGCLARVADALQGGGPLAHPAPGPKRPRGTGYLRVQVDGDEL